MRRGALPFRVLNLPESASMDGYNSKLQYVVTEPLAVASTYNDLMGGIQINDYKNNMDNPLFGPTSGARYLVFSTGPDRKGAYTQNGLQTSGCDTAALDGENCNTLADARAIYREAPWSESNGASHFDDTLSFIASKNAPLWRATGPTGLAPNNVSDMINAGSSTSGVFGIGNQANRYTLELTRDAHASGHVMTKTLCNNKYSGNENCFAPEKIGGNDNFMNCSYNGSGGQYVTTIQGLDGTKAPQQGAVTCSPYPTAVACRLLRDGR